MALDSFSNLEDALQGNMGIFSSLRLFQMSTICYNVATLHWEGGRELKCNYFHAHLVFWQHMKTS